MENRKGADTYKKDGSGLDHGGRGEVSGPGIYSGGPIFYNTR